MENKDVAASPAQLRYATMLHWGSLIGLIVMVVTFVLYLLEMSLEAPYVPLEKLVATWHLSAAEFNATHEVPIGWGWLNLLLTGDFSNFKGIAILAGITILCYIQLAIDFFRTKENLMAIIAVLEVIVLTVAATGLVGGAH